MGDLKAIGSEKLTGQEKIQRIIEIARFKENLPKPVNETAKSQYTINLADGNNYQIVKEKLGYIIKKTINESETDYIEPMKNRKYFNSYSQALKRLNLLAGELNRLNENEEGISLYGEQKKFVLKTPKPAEPEAPVAAPPAEPPAVPAPELPMSPSEDLPAEDGMDDLPAEDDMSSDVEVDAEVDVESPEGSGPISFKQIQKLTGKLTQKMRELDNDQGMTSEDIKYVVNMVLSAADLKNLTDEDKDDILSKFEEDETSDEMDMDNLGGDDMDGEDMTDDTEVEDIQADMDVPVESEMEEDFGSGAILDSIFSESKIDKLISRYFEVSDTEKRKLQEQKVTKDLVSRSKLLKKMESVRKLTETVEQEIASKKFLEENSNFKFVGKTNLKNLVFENKDKQIKISPEGLVL
jgi:hypothetical protein